MLGLKLNHVNKRGHLWSVERSETILSEILIEHKSAIENAVSKDKLWYGI